MSDNDVVSLLQQILETQEDQFELLTELVAKQPTSAVSQNDPWKEANPRLAKRCTEAAHRAGELMTGLIESMVSDLEDIETDQFDGNFAVTELIDRYGQKLQQLHVMSNALSNLGT